MEFFRKLKLLLHLPVELGAYQQSVRTQTRITLDALLALHRRHDKMAHTLQEILDLVEAERTAVGSLSALIAGLRQQLADALAQIPDMTPEQQAAIDKIFDDASMNLNAITTALQANTPTGVQTMPVDSKLNTEPPGVPGVESTGGQPTDAQANVTGSSVASVGNPQA